MKRKSNLLILLGLVVAAIMTLPQVTAKPANVDAAVQNVMQQQVDAWNKGDLEKFMTFYMKSKDLSYTSGGIEVWGFDALQKRYEKRYGNNKATMGKLSFADLKVFPLGKDNALCIGHWHLERKGEAHLDGTFSLVFVSDHGQWKILHDHTSVADKKKP